MFADATVSFRGMTSVDDSLIFISGSKGTIAKYNIEQDKLSKAALPEKYKQTDFRDIKHLGAGNLLAVGISSPAYVLRSSDYGSTWHLVYEDTSKNIFLNGAIVLDNARILLYGDPDESGTFDLLLSADLGKTFSRLPVNERPHSGENGGMFAASGTSGMLVNDTIYIAIQSASGVALVKKQQDLNPADVWQLEATDIPASGSSGIFSLAAHKNSMMAFGGEYTQPNEKRHSVWKNVEGKWTVINLPFRCGYYSCGVFNSHVIVATGTCETTIYDRSLKQTTSIEKAFHTCRLVGNTVYFAGPNGTFGTLRL